MTAPNWKLWRELNTAECEEEGCRRRILPWHDRCIQHELREARRQRRARERFLVPRRRTTTR